MYCVLGLYGVHVRFSSVFIYARLLYLLSENSSPSLVSEKTEHVDVCLLLFVHDTYGFLCSTEI